MKSRFTKALRLSAAIAALSLAMPAVADPNPGAYLAARAAGIDGDYAAAARYFRAALLADPGNTVLMEQTLTAFLGTGQVESAARIATPFLEAGGESQIANIALMAQAARTEDWDAIFDMLEAGQEVGPLLDGLAQSWAYVGKGQMDRALMSFDEVIDTPGLRSFGSYHKAMALTLVGDLEGADALYSLPPGQGVVPTRGSVLAHLHVMCQLGKFDEAQEMLDRAFNTTGDAELSQMAAAIANKEVPSVGVMVTTPAEGIGYGFISLTDVLQGEANESYLLLYAQAARHISPLDADGHLSAARLLNALGQYEAAAETFAQVSTDDTDFYSAEIGRAEALRLAGRFDQSAEVLTQLTRSHPDLPLAHVTLGDLHRQQDAYADAIASYDTAMGLYDEDAPIRWWVHYVRAMSYERLDQWPAAEADFRAALELNPGDPSVLNYLGYSMVDRGMFEKYDEALGMIETAVEARPDSGAITDSLAWVYYKLGRYQEAVTPMERAAELEPNDPIISDHLGDVYWMVGRETEARFQWRRALSFNPEEEEANRIRRKLAIGLNAVYAEDGEVPAPAVEVARDD